MNLTWQRDWFRQMTGFLDTNVPIDVDFLIIGTMALVNLTEEIKRTFDTTGITTVAHRKTRQILMIKVAVLFNRLADDSAVFTVPHHIGNSFHVVGHFYHNR